MSKYILYQLCSNDPENYGELTFNPIIPWNCEQVEYRIKSVNTFANFMITTTDDYITINDLTIYFPNQSSYDIDELADTLTSLLSASSVSIVMNNSRTLTFSSISEFEIANASHRVKLLLGLFDCSFPISSTLNDELYTLTAPAAPMVSFGNVLYLQSLQGSAVGSRVDKNTIQLQ